MSTMNIPNSRRKELIELIQAFFLESTFLICESNNLSEYEILNEIKHFEENLQASSTVEIPESIEKWFEKKKTDILTSNSADNFLTLVIETVLDLSQLPPTDFLTLKDREGNSWNVCKGGKKSGIVLERWLIELDNKSSTFENYKIQHEEEYGDLNNKENERKYINETKKQIILLARYLYTLIQLLPTSNLIEYISKGDIKSKLSLQIKVMDGSQTILSKGRIGLSKPIINTYANVLNETNIPAHLEQRKLTPIWTELGLLRISSSLRIDTKFEINKIVPVKSKSTDNGYKNIEYGAKINSQDYATDVSEHNALQDTASRNMDTLVSQPALQSSRSQGNNAFISVSPHTNMLTGVYSYPYSTQNHSLGSRKSSLSKSLNPFKQAVVLNSGNSPQMLLNNTSNASVAAVTKNQRSRNSSMSAANTHSHDIPTDSFSVGSGSKYSSSFSRLHRHSSIKSTEINENQLKVIPKRTTSSDDLLDFMKLLEDKQDLNVGKAASKLNTSMIISNSLLHYQKLKPSNTILSDDLSLSVIGEPGSTRNRRVSVSNSSIPSVSSPIQYTSIYSRLSKANVNGSDIHKGGVQGKESSYEKEKALDGNSERNLGTFGIRPRSLSNDSLTSVQRILPIQKLYSGDNFSFDEDEEMLVSVRGSPNNKLKKSVSPHSIDSINSYISKNRLPFQQPSYYSNPTTAAVPAYAKLHKPNILSTEMLEEESKKKGEANNSDNTIDENHSRHIKEDEDELLFFMSDMNISKD
ncbi:hypothetical protein TPHA_0I03300 [Tetrapisispora phaffii CBS 4417]|uniref:Autophagy-related protein 13 n=1 Tax=Tetrapisispora phaffii (strain ATCC 24235 / CBS 4417 / NBRC 1672 / NRRL Y-8282 / UCD 70-5) TaxID=1071381 RepID=G8BY53_TETPH|nr:hypothetical protein TPHA_0I03300 [Tetrapisispora phaffii CBS 4417]CCE64831.1 hypothetical protein TPHA_0I03300 [Tetrapisispora phaffii CBS 4417]